MSSDKGRALMACPTYAGKDYSLAAWVAGYRALTYRDVVAYQVDNTRSTQAYFKKIRSIGIDCSHVIPWQDWDRTFKRCWDLMLKRAYDLDCYWVYSVEADNVPAPESLEVMVDVALYGRLHLVTHTYPLHASAAEASGMKATSWYYNELGCMLMTRSLLQRAIDEFEEYGNIAASIFNTNERYHGGSCKLTNRFEVKHLDGYEQSFQNLGPSEVRGLVMPTPRMPADYGQKLPEVLNA